MYKRQAYEGGDLGGGDVGVSQGAFGGLHADLGEVVYGGEAFFFLENSGEVSGVCLLYTSRCV